VLEHKNAISLKRVKIDEKLLWRAYRKSPTLFRTVPSPTPYGVLFLKILSQEKVNLRTANLADTFTGFIRTKAHEKFGRKGTVGVSKDCPAVNCGLLLWCQQHVVQRSETEPSRLLGHVQRA